MLSADASGGLAAGLNLDNYKSEFIGERGTDYSKERKTWVRNSEGELIPVMAKSGGGNCETIYDARFAEVLFNVSTSKE